MELSNSQKIYEAFSFVRTVTEEIDALKKALDETIAHDCSDQSRKYRIDYEGDDDELRPEGRYNWLLESYCVSYSLSEKRRKRTLGYLYYLFDLSYQGGPAEQLKQALVCVGYVGEQVRKKHPQEMKLEAFYPWNPAEVDKKGNCWKLSSDAKVWYWNGGKKDLSDVENTCWVYFVPLATITNHTDVLSTLVKPAIDVLHNKPEPLANVARALRFDNGGSFKMVVV